MLEFLMKLFGFGMPCLFYTITGLYCPGCGGTRAVISLLRGDAGMSFRCHPLVLYMAVVAVLEFGTYVLSKLLHRPGLHIKRYRLFTTVAAAVVLVNWVFKNYMLFFRGVDLLAGLIY